MQSHVLEYYVSIYIRSMAVICSLFITVKHKLVQIDMSGAKSFEKIEIDLFENIKVILKAHNALGSVTTYFLNY